LSLDGPREFHDLYRLTRGNHGSHSQAVRAFKLLSRHEIPVDVLCVVHDQNVRHPGLTYDFFRDMGVRSLSFLPLVQRSADEPGGVTASSVPAERWGEFLCTVFDEWVRHDVGRLAVQIIEEATRPTRGLEHSLCVLRPTCGDIPVVEHNGDVFCCDHFVDVSHRVGNLRDTTLGELLENPELRAFGEAKRSTLPAVCRSCEVLPQCNGGCPKDRFVRTSDGAAGLNYLCAGFKRFFTHALKHMMPLGPSARDRSEIAMQWVLPVRTARPATTGVGRNDPCPCGSGKKFKKCCLARGTE
jgi:uncharacterized protein